MPKQETPVEETTHRETNGKTNEESQRREKSEKNDKIKDPAKIKTGLSGKGVLTEEDIRKKASEIYHNRIERAEQGTAEKDWFEAEKYLREVD